MEQAEGLKLKPREDQARPEWDAHRDAEKVIAASGPTVEHVAGDRAYYRMDEDKVVLPEQSQFPTRNGLLPDGASRVRPCDRPPGSHEPRHAQRRNGERLWIAGVCPRRNCGPRSAP